MNPYEHYLNTLVNNNREKYKEFQGLKWAHAYNSAEAEQWRNELLITHTKLFKATKPYVNRISEGCNICGNGRWSCLFITGICNAKCFYCPTSQDSDEIPATQSLTFPSPEDYAEYINYFDFKGVSFSGGEPLMAFNRTLDYLTVVRKNCKSDLYIWMYTNGLLADQEKLRQLANAGINEIRFDIGATGYSTNYLKNATGIISNITVEIPAVPEEKQQIIALLPELIKHGVQNLNLHQLRLTPYNAAKLLKRNYTYISAEHPIAIESELTALEIIDYVIKNQLDIGVNYCSFSFKNRFQKAGFRRLIALKENEQQFITEKGFVRNILMDGVSYSWYSVSDQVSNGSYKKIQLSDKKSFYVKKNFAQPIKYLNTFDLKKINQIINQEPAEIPHDELEFRIWEMEYIEPGLRNFYL